MAFQLSSLSSKLSDFTLNLIAAIVILLVGLVIGRFLGNLTRKVLHELELDKLLREQTRFKIPLEQFLGSLVKFIVYFIAIIFALDQLGLQTAILNIILAIIIMIIVIFMILAIKDFIPNLMAGLFLHQKRNIKPGERIEVNNVEGEVINITLTETKLRTRSGEIVYIPNSVLTKNVVIKKK
ncbi:MAG: Small-conductance mechanosensitive channel [archaeon GW2011_AR20]|nr:MAG: Small-conductance mechanosensitive channel [archaeon GW2011_AR20]MBS3160963.1 mechanosensitive ion channel [Candidatus Woesearchaeota archaeon]